MAYENNRTPIVSEILRDCRWFSKLPETIRSDFLKNGNLVELKKGQKLLSTGDTKPCLYCVVSGAVGLFSYLDCGKEVLVTVLEPVSWGGELSIFDNIPRTHSVVATKKTFVFVIQQESISKSLDSNPILWKYLGQLVSQKLRAVLKVSDIMTTLAGPARLAHRLLLMARNNGSWVDRKRKIIDVQQEDLARMTYLTRTTVNQLLKRFEGCGAVRVHYGKVEISDEAILDEIVKNGEKRFPW